MATETVRLRIKKVPEAVLVSGQSYQDPTASTSLDRADPAGLVLVPWITAEVDGLKFAECFAAAKQPGSSPAASPTPPRCHTSNTKN